jgi:CubicO group peptidase (beta-lactamase class C family)
VNLRLIRLTGKWDIRRCREGLARMLADLREDVGATRARYRVTSSATTLLSGTAEGTTMIRIARIGVAVMAVTAVIPGAAQDAPAAAPDPMIAKVEAGLAGRVHVAGEPVDAWSLSDRMAFYDVPGVSIAVIKDGKIAWAKGYGVLQTGARAPVDADTLFQAASISKPVAAIAALRLVEQGKLALDEPINAYLESWKVPDNDFTARRPVTLRQIMSHAAGFTVHGFPGYAAGQPVPTVTQVLDGAAPANTAAVRVDKSPGESWRYSGGGYTVLQLAMTDVSKQSFADLTRELVLAPSGMTRSAYSQPLPDADRMNAATAHRADGSVVPGYSHTYPEMAAAGLWTTPTDLMRLALSVVAAARSEPGAILAPETTRQMLTTQAGSFGLGFDLADRGDGQIFSHSGSNAGFLSLMFAYTDGRGGAAIMTNSQRGGELHGEIAASIAAAYGWNYGAPEERTALVLTPERAAEFAGDYVAKSPAGAQPAEINFRIVAEGNELSLEAVPPVIPKQRFYVASETEVFAVMGPIVPFTTDANGRPAAIHLGPDFVAVRRKN